MELGAFNRKVDGYSARKIPTWRWRGSLFGDLDRLNETRQRPDRYTVHHGRTSLWGVATTRQQRYPRLEKSIGTKVSSGAFLSVGGF